MSNSETASIIITCYNYGHFLKECIDSALNQTYPNTEVIVVDDGSTDVSRKIIDSYGNQIQPILKENGGMASAFNVGFSASHGEMICFLDADDTLHPQAMATAFNLYRKPGVAKVHWPLWTVDEQGCRTGGVHPPDTLSEGDLRDCVIRKGCEGYIWPVTTGNAWARSFLEVVFPIPEAEYRGCAESYLAALAPAFGAVRRIPQPMGTYRLHGGSLSNRRLLSKMIKEIDQRYLAIQNGFRRIGIDVNPEKWPPSTAFRNQILLSCQELAELIPPGSRFGFVEWNQWGPGQIVPECQAVPFLEKNGEFWGVPLDDATAILELERLSQSGANFIVFGWPAFWWLEHYSGFHAHLRSHFPCVLENERLVVFELRQ